jgi:hypothetical protein
LSGALQWRCDGQRGGFDAAQPSDLGYLMRIDSPVGRPTPSMLAISFSLRVLQPSGSDEEPIAILLRRQPHTVGRVTILTTGSLARVAARIRPFLTERTHSIGTN